ncbi:MAG: hypothetical protein KAV44_10215 [Bacteroidales bacterium]|jgi:hypothetical protein|nr:hypothetical protein [Bacteroidales bacterium]
MYIYILIIFFGIPIIVIPLLNKKLLSKKKPTFIGVVFLICVLVVASLQITKETETIKMEEEFNRLKELDIESKRPQLILRSPEIVRLNKNEDEDEFKLDFKIENHGERSATNIYGKIYRLFDVNNKDIILHDSFTFPLSRSFIMPTKLGYTFTYNLTYSEFNDRKIIYYFELYYNDILTDNQYRYDIAVFLPKYTEDNYPPKLMFCRDWYMNKIKDVVNNRPSK